MKYRLAYYIFAIKARLSEKFTTLISRLSAYYWGVNLGKRLRFIGRPRFRNLGQIHIGEGTRIISNQTNLVGEYVKTAFQTGVNGRIVIGSNCGISNCLLISQSSITIESQVYIGGGTRIYDNDFHSIDPDLRLNQPEIIPTKPILIKDKAFIGGHSIILKGVTIGKNSVIGAGSVVTSSVPDNEIWAGVPAKKIGVVE